MKLSICACSSILLASLQSKHPHVVLSFSPLPPIASLNKKPITTSIVTQTGASTSAITSSKTTLYSSVSETSDLINSLRSNLAENEDASNIMKALRGQGMNDDDRAADGVQMRLVDEEIALDGKTGLPYAYDPQILKEYFSKRPLVVIKRLLQVISVGGGFVFQSGLDQITGRSKNDPDLEVKRTGELRDLITSLGPFYIKLGQALSIRPDVLSPRSMVELQKLCDKVPSYDSKIAFNTIERELGKSVDSLFSEITPEPVAAASLGQGMSGVLKLEFEIFSFLFLNVTNLDFCVILIVYKATLRKNGQTVAVKVQR